MSILAQQAVVIEGKRTELAQLFATHKKGDAYDMPANVLEEVNRRNDELNELTSKYEQARGLIDQEQKNAQALEQLREVKRPGHADPSGEPQKKASRRPSLGDLFVKSETFKQYSGGRGPVSAVPDYDLKTLFATSAGWDPEDLRTGRVVLDEQEMPRIADIIPKTTTKMSTVLYMEETTYTNNAAEAAEGAAYGEAALVLTEKSSEVRKIAVFLPVTDEQMEDVDRIGDYVNNRLTNMLRQRLDTQLIAGDGTAPNLRGLLNVVGIGSQAKGTDPTPDAIYKGITKVRVDGKAEASHVIMHPNDWQDVRLLRTADGIYIWGSPSESGVARIWGLPVITSTFETENTGLVGDFRNYSELAMRRGIEFEVSNSHDTFFTAGKKAIRADFRVAFVVYRPTAFTKITGL